MKVKPFPKKRGRIEIIPLIDVMFLLLVFFVYTMISMTTHRGVRVDLPYAVTGVIDKRSHLMITITREGEFFLDKRPVARENLLLELMAARREKGENLTLFINADRRALHEWVTDALDAARRTGITQVSIETTRRRRVIVPQ